MKINIERVRLNTKKEIDKLERLIQEERNKRDEYEIRRSLVLVYENFMILREKDIKSLVKYRNEFKKRILERYVI